MTLILELPQVLEEELTQEADKLGEPVSEYAIRLLASHSSSGLLHQDWINNGLLEQPESSLPALDSAQFHLPDAVQARLQYLLDTQDTGTPLTSEERGEAEGLVELAEMLSLIRLRMLRSTQQPSTNG